jgi:hypothetical protein
MARQLHRSRAHLEGNTNMNFRIAGALGALIIVAGCERRDDASPREVVTPAESPESPERATTPVGATREPTAQPPTEVKGEPVHAQAIDAITNERCAREQRCGNIGADQKFSSHDECTTKTRSDWAGDLSAYECPGGIDQKELNECLAEIRNDDCNNPFDSLERIVACRSSDICLNVGVR